MSVCAHVFTDVWIKKKMHRKSKRRLDWELQARLLLSSFFFRVNQFHQNFSWILNWMLKFIVPSMNNLRKFVSMNRLMINEFWYLFLLVCIDNLWSSSHTLSRNDLQVIRTSIPSVLYHGLLRCSPLSSPSSSSTFSSGVSRC